MGVVWGFLNISSDEVVNEEGWCVAVLGSKHFAIWCRVREGDFFLGEMTAVHEGASKKGETLHYSMDYFYIPGVCSRKTLGQTYQNSIC